MVESDPQVTSTPLFSLVVVVLMRSKAGRWVSVASVSFDLNVGVLVADSVVGQGR
jgi:hypothetical protein